MRIKCATCDHLSIDTDHGRLLGLRDHDGTTGVRADFVPEDGDVNICMMCGSLNIFEDGQLRKPNDEEAAELLMDSDVQNMVAMWHVTNRNHTTH